MDDPGVVTAPARAAWPARTALVLGTAIAVVAWHLLLGRHWVNSDGSGYLSVALNLHKGRGLRLPDGTAASWRRPVLPALLSLPWLSGTGVVASQWVLRAVVGLAPLAIGLSLWQRTRSWLAAGVAVAIGILQPWTLLAGGSSVVPDGVAAAGVAVAACAALAAFAPDVARRRRWLAVTGVAAAFAVFTKETGAVALPLVLLVAVHSRLTDTWRRLALVALVIGCLVGLIFTAGPTDVSLIRLPAAFVEQVGREAFNRSLWWVPWSICAAGLVAWAGYHVQRLASATGLAMVLAGLTIAAYAAGRHFGVRNGALMPLGLALIAGDWVSGRNERAWAPRSLVAAATAGLLVAGTAGGVVFNTYAAHIISWDNGATSEAAVWLHDHAASERVSCTLLLCSQIWFRAGGDLDISLLPQFAARTGPTRLADLRFDERNGWSGRTRVSRPDEGRVLVLTKSDELFGGVFEGALLDDLNRRRPRYVAVTGNVASNATFEAGRLLPYFRDNPSFRLVFTSSLDALPTFVAIYEMTGPARPRPAGPGLISTRATKALRGLPAGAVQWLPARIFRQMVRQVLVSAPARGA